MEDDGQLERVERPLSACLPLRSWRLNIATQTEENTAVVSGEGDTCSSEAAGPEHCVTE